jgi:hypothetical protein
MFVKYSLPAVTPAIQTSIRVFLHSSKLILSSLSVGGFFLNFLEILTSIKNFCSHDQRAGIDGRKERNTVWVSPVTYYTSQYVHNRFNSDWSVDLYTCARYIRTDRHNCHGILRRFILSFYWSLTRIFIRQNTVYWRRITLVRDFRL